MKALALLARRWPITVRIPLFVAVLMVAVSATLSEQVLRRLEHDQGERLRDLATSYLEGLASAIRPHLIRQDVWECFDVLERSRTGSAIVRATFTTVILPDGRVLAASDPLRFPTLQPLPPALAARFGVADGIVIDEDAGRAWLRRSMAEAGTPIGTILAEVDISDQIAVRQEVLVTLVLINGALTSLFAAVGYFGARRMVAPAQLLTEYVERARDGAIEPIPPRHLADAHDEFGRLFHRFNEMATAVREREALAARLAAEEKVALIGKLATGLAHEVNNPLGGLLNLVDTLKEHGGDPAVRQASLDLLERGLSSIRDLTRATLVPYKDDDGVQVLGRADLDDLALLIRHEVERRRLRLDWDNAVPERVGIARGPIRQVALNLLLNACAASPVGATVRFAAQAVGPAMRLEISDTGGGMPEATAAILRRCDETAAPPQGNTGLGAWTVARLVGRLRGSVEVVSSDSGTTVAVTLPLAATAETLDAVA